MITNRPRMWHDGAIYHITMRGVRQMEIFRTTEDRSILIKFMKDVQKDYPFIIHSFCFMTNHFHLLIETKNVEISKIMQRIAYKYSRYFNHKYKYSGHLFDKRFGSKLVLNDIYFLQVSHYIHRNPVKAKLVSKPENYLWSSYPRFLGMKDDKITETGKILGFFEGVEGITYQEFVEREGQKYMIVDGKIRICYEPDKGWFPDLS